MPVLNLPRLTADRFYAVHPTTGRPVAYGTVTLYAAGTNTLKSGYADRAGVNPSLNPIPLGADGGCEVYLSGPYRIVVKDANGVTVQDLDQVNSIIAETEAGNPGSLIANNNLSDLTDVVSARDALSLTKQETISDATADRLMIVGAFGLGGNVPEVTAVSALNGITVTKWVRVAAANVATVGGPTGAGAGVVQTIAYGSTQVAQTYYPVTGTASAPWTRLNALGTWTPWVRQYDRGNILGTVSQSSGTPTGAIIQSGGDDSNGRFTRWANGDMDLVFPLVSFTRVSTGRCEATIGFPSSFIDTNYVMSGTLRPLDITGSVGTIDDACAPEVSMIFPTPVVAVAATNGCTAAVHRVSGQTNFEEGDQVHAGVRIRGRWF